MTPPQIERALELGLVGLALIIITAPIWLPVMLWRAFTREDY